MIVGQYVCVLTDFSLRLSTSRCARGPFPAKEAARRTVGWPTGWLADPPGCKYTLVTVIVLLIMSVKRGAPLYEVREALLALLVRRTEVKSALPASQSTTAYV